MIDDDPDAAEDFITFVKRYRFGPEGTRVGPDGRRKAPPEYWTPEDDKQELHDLKVEWGRTEKTKRERRQQKAHVQKSLEREYRETQRKREREDERNRRDPIPLIQPSDFKIEIPEEIRDQHIYLPGGTRRGKSTTILNLILQDINNGEGVAVLDPKGDLIRRICYLLPPSRINDCIYLDLETPIPLDLMRHTPKERNSLINNLVYIITKGDANLPAAEPLLRRTIRSLLHVDGVSFLDIYRFFTDRERRDYILAQLEIKSPELWRSWNPFPAETKYTPITSRMENFYWNPTFNAIFGSPNAELNLSTIMDKKQILLVNLSPADADCSLYGSLLVSKFEQAIKRRSAIHEHKREPFYLYVDEFELFQTDSFAEILSLAGGLGLRLIIGNQFLDQVDSRILSAVVGNAGTYIIFQLGPKDSPLFANKIAPYGHAHLERLEPYQAIFKVGPNPPIFKRTALPEGMPPKLSAQQELQVDKVFNTIKENTLRDYGPTRDPSAQSSPKRTVDKSGCNEPHIMLPLKNVPESNGNATTPANVLRDDPEAGRSHKPRKV